MNRKKKDSSNFRNKQMRRKINEIKSNLSYYKNFRKKDKNRKEYAKKKSREKKKD